MSEMITYDSDVLKRQFIELYYLRGSDDSPDKLMKKIGAPQRMLTEWVSDSTFQRELEQIDYERAWMAKEVIYRRVGDIFNNIAQMAVEHKSGAIKAAELMFRIAGILKTAGGGGGTQVTINNTLGDDALKGMNLEELTKQRDELAGILAQLAQPAEFEEEAP